MRHRILCRNGDNVHVGRWEEGPPSIGVDRLNAILRGTSKDHRFVLHNGESIYLMPSMVRASQFKIQRLVPKVA